MATTVLYHGLELDWDPILVGWRTKDPADQHVAEAMNAWVAVYLNLEEGYVPSREEFSARFLQEKMGAEIINQELPERPGQKDEQGRARVY